MRLAACGATVTGPRHLSRGEDNQDSCVLRGCRGGWIAAVADGLGSRPLSGVGSRAACRAACDRLKRAGATDTQEMLAEVHRDWVAGIASLTADEAATTLIMAMVDAKGNGIAAQIGDGLALIREGGRFRRLTPARMGFGNMTDALTAVHRPELWVWADFSLAEPGDGIALMTDGVADDLDPDGLPAFLDALGGDVRRRGRRRGRRWLETELTDWATPMHSDDKSLVAIFRDG